MADERFTLSVANGGEPILQGILERLFLPFYLGEGRSSWQGLGLGLYIASAIGRVAGGQFDFGRGRHSLYISRCTSGAIVCPFEPCTNAGFARPSGCNDCSLRTAGRYAGPPAGRLDIPLHRPMPC